MAEFREKRSPHEHDPDDPRGGGGPGGEAAAYLGGHLDAGPNVTPGRGGYAGRDPKTDMPAVPSMPETQDHLGGAEDPSAKQGISYGAPFGHAKVGREEGIHVAGENASPGPERPRGRRQGAGWAGLRLRRRGARGAAGAKTRKPKTNRR